MYNVIFEIPMSLQSIYLYVMFRNLTENKIIIGIDGSVVIYERYYLYFKWYKEIHYDISEFYIYIVFTGCLYPFFKAAVHRFALCCFYLRLIVWFAKFSKGEIFDFGWSALLEICVLWGKSIQNIFRFYEGRRGGSHSMIPL